MNIKLFTVSGFTRFYRSLLRFNRNMERDYALKLTYNLYTSVKDICRMKKPDVSITEYSEADFYAILQKSSKPPYKTIVQMYRAMEALFYAVAPEVKNLSLKQSKDFLAVLNMMDDMELRFRGLFNVKIDNERTVYSMCAGSLTPRRDEPGLCLMRDWIDAVSSSCIIKTDRNLKSRGFAQKFTQ